ncbi:MAG: PfkB family carbohydrate kinase [Ilumatobacteraceae bacterium]
MIVVGGEALVDLVIDPDGSVAAKLGGGPFNAARAIGRLGSEVAFLGALSRDRFGTLLHARLLDDQVDDSLVQFTELPTTLASAELDEHGAASYRFYLSETAAPNLHPLPLPENVTILHVGTLGIVLQPMASTLEAVVGGIGDSVLVLLDPNCRPRVTSDRVGYMARLERMLRRADVVKVSTDDLDFIAPDDHSSGVRMLLEDGASLVLHTDGGCSVHVHWPTDQIDIPVPTVEVVDTIGAGDAFGGAFAAWWDQAELGRRDLHDRDAVSAAVCAAVEVAAVSCTRVGAQPPRRAELGHKWSPARS